MFPGPEYVNASRLENIGKQNMKSKKSLVTSVS